MYIKTAFFYSLPQWEPENNINKPYDSEAPPSHFVLPILWVGSSGIFNCWSCHWPFTNWSAYFAHGVCARLKLDFLMDSKLSTSYSHTKGQWNIANLCQVPIRIITSFLCKACGNSSSSDTITEVTLVTKNLTLIENYQHTKQSLCMYLSHSQTHFIRCGWRQRGCVVAVIAFLVWNTFQPLWLRTLTPS